MADVWSIIVSIAAALTAFFLFLEWYGSWKDKKNKVWATRTLESQKWHITVRARKPDGVEDCTSYFDGKQLLEKNAASSQPMIIIGGGAENFLFWAGDEPTARDDRQVIVKEKGKTIYRRKFKEVYLNP
jgi:hypothetical protein